ncbi:mechanosensitive ion channel family protein [Candidatus Peregrinibacteria bacterium]|nr:mechanosensitive ion channel family protein [Candidatus Peregrinibacteria bacterium]
MATTIPATSIPTNGVSEGQIDFAAILPQILMKFVEVIEGAAIIVVGLFVIKFVRSRLRKIESTHEQQKNAINLLDKLITGFIIVVSITMALKVVGLDMTLLISVAILGLSYGLQDIIKNYVAGILILFKSPFKLNDIIKIRDYTGRVIKMDFQATTLETFDARQITIYNSDVMTQSIVNFSNNTVRRLDFDVVLGYGSDVDSALKIFEKLMKTNTKILKSPKYSIIFKKFTDLGPSFTLKFWIQRPCNILKIKTDLAKEINKAFDDQKVIMPYYKGIEAGSEPELSTMTEERKTRVQAFQNQPVFTQPEIPPQVQLGPDGQPIPQVVPVAYDEDEPE